MVLKKTVTKPGFDLVYKGDSFKCAFITKSDQYSFGKVTTMKRHNESDEVFTLLRGKAVLLTGDPVSGQYDKTDMQLETFYCVEAGTWHHMAVTEDAVVFVAENFDVSKQNTNELNIEEQNIILQV